MANGIPISMDKVMELEKVLDDVLAQVNETLYNNPIIRQFQADRFKDYCDEFTAEQLSKMRKPSDFIKPFNCSDMTHRSYLMHVLSLHHPSPSDSLPTGITKWTLQHAKAHLDHPTVALLISKQLTDNNRYVKQAMQLLGEHKAAIHNKRYEDNIANLTEADLPPFNPASSVQKQLLFASLGIESESTSKDTGLPKWNRDEVERVNKSTSDPAIKELTQAFIDHSFGAIVKNNFIQAFYSYTINGTLYGSIKLFGAKSFRLTSSDPFN